CRREYETDVVELKKIDEFEKHYRPNQAVYWYTRDSFVYRLVNKALRTEDFCIINKYRLLITDLHTQLTKLHEQFYKQDLTCPGQTFYRGQQLSVKELEKSNFGQLITFNGFLSVTSSKDVALIYADTTKDDSSASFQSVLFTVKVDNRKGLFSTFHTIEKLSNFSNENEVLFSLGTIFRVQSIVKDETDRLWNIELKLRFSIIYVKNPAVLNYDHLNGPSATDYYYQIYIKQFC
ncbi:unnamed protein product, partial [Didymodactylos carnosus]